MEARLTIDDLRANGHCASGVRSFFKEHNLDLRKAAGEGLTREDTAHVDDAMLEACWQVAERRVSGGQ